MNTKPRNVTYGLIALITAGLVYMLYMAVLHWQHFYSVFSGRVLPGTELSVVLSVYSNPLLSLHIIDFLLVVIASCLSGLQIALLWYVSDYRSSQVLRRGEVSGFLANVLVFLGVGCASCGSLVLTSLLSGMGIFIGVGLLPWLSKILLLFAVGVLLRSNIKLYKQAKNPLVCQI